MSPEDRCAHARRLRLELESKLDSWRSKVMEVQEKSIKKAEERVRRAREDKRARVASENRDRYASKI